MTVRHAPAVRGWSPQASPEKLLSSADRWSSWPLALPSREHQWHFRVQTLTTSSIPRPLQGRRRFLLRIGERQERVGIRRGVPENRPMPREDHTDPTEASGPRDWWSCPVWSPERGRCLGRALSPPSRSKSGNASRRSALSLGSLGCFWLDGLRVPPQPHQTLRCHGPGAA